MNRRYRKGSRFERELKEKLERLGYAVIRSAGSKGVDLIAGKRGEQPLIIECKSSSKPVFYVPTEDIRKLLEYCQNFRAIPILAIRFRRKTFLLQADLLDLSKKNVKIDDEVLSKCLRV